MEGLYKFIVALLVTLIFVSFFFFLLYKIRQIRTRREVKSAYFNALSRISFGVLLIVFGLNSIVQFQSAVAYLIGILFILLGSYQVYHFIQAKNYFKSNLPIEDKAWEDFERQKNKK